MRTPFLLAFAVLATSCAKDSAGPPAASHEERRNEIAANGLAANAHSLLKGHFRYACDEEIEPMRQEIADALEARLGEIQAWQQNGPGNPNGNYKVVPFGPTYARERVTPPVVRPGWQDDKTSWSEIIDFYKKIKGTPVDSRWVSLNSDVRAVMIDDVDRILYGENYQLDETSEPGLNRLISELETCVNDTSCLDPKFSPESLTFINSMIRVKRHLQIVQESTTDAEKRSSISDFLAWEKTDHRSFEFTKNPLLRTTSPGHYVLPLDPGPFAGAAEQLRRYVEDMWKDDSHAVTLELAPRDGVFSVVLGTDPGGRSFVSYKKKTVNLNPNVRARSVAHELGHVIGFTDNYFSIFDPTTCSWDSRGRDDDVMSDPATGAVLPSHWTELKKQYE